MYPVTNEFKLAAKQPVQEHRLYGTIGSVSFDKSNIIQGSFHITNQCTDTNDVVLGSVYTGTLTATFTGLSIPRYAWIGKRITVYFGLKTTPTTWEDIPMGTFTVKEAKHSAEGVSVTAYDDMIKLDKKFKKSKFKEPAKIYNFLTTICNTCGLILEDSEQTIQSRPNGNTLLGIVGTASNSKLKKYANDIETYRDLVFWIAQSMACFATINKLGHLTFVPYKNENNVVDEITETHRIAGAVFDDFTTNYTGIYVTNTTDGEEIYYGYDEQELEQEIATVEGDIQYMEIALDQLAQQYQQGQITEAEYKRQKKVLDKQLKNLDKRLAWLNEALDKARSEEDGLYMDLGENPMMQADGVGNTPTTMRKRILKALDAISYTPFTCDTVCGAHYDLGDIIRFTGGHATELGEVCCVMAYDFNMNGEYRMQGFGSDPSKGVMKSKNSKKADKANRNADNSAKSTTGYSSPDSGNDGDLFVKVNANADAESIYAGTGMTIDSQSGDNNSGYTVVAHCTDDTKSESIHFKYENLVVGRTYTLSCSIKIDEINGNWGSNYFCICVRSQDSLSGATIPFAPGGTVTPLSNGVAVTLYYDTNEHSYQVSFSAPAATCYVIIDISYLHNTWYGTTCPTHVNNLKISEGSEVSNGNPDGIKVYVNDEWKNLDYVKKVVQYQPGIIGGGTKIFEAKNSDGSTTDIFSPIVKVDDVKMNNTSVVVDKVAKIVNMTGATSSDAGTAGLVPAPAAGDDTKFLCGDGTFKTVSGGSSITPNPSGTATDNLEKVTIESTIYAIKDTNAVHNTDKGVANGVASLDANGKVPSAQLPSYVDDVVEGYYDTTTDRFYEESTFTTVIPPEDGKSWVDVASNKSYRWTGSVYVRVDEGVQLGETSNTAYRGDRGKIAYDHATESGKISAAVASGLYKIAATAEGHIASLTAVEKSDLTELGLVDKSGDTMTGNLTVRANVIVNNDSNGGGHDLIIGHANASDSEQQCYIKFYRGQVSATTSLQAEQNINYDPDTGRFTPDANNYTILLPCKSGTIALSSDIQALDGVITGSAGAGKTLTAFSQTDGVVTATFADISITKSQISDFPTIPTVNNSTITIKKNGTTVDSFTLNQSTGKDIDISVPTKTSDLTNDSGYVTTDEKVTGQTENPSTGTYYYIPFIGSNNQKPYINDGLQLYSLQGTTSAVGFSILRLGNLISSGTAGNKYGILRLYSRKTKYVDLVAASDMTTADRTIYLPDKAGTIALTADLTTYAFAEGTNNGEIKITPSVGGTAGTAVTVKPKGISDLAYIAKGSGSSRFLREDGQWTTVTASWSGGQVTSNIYPNAQSTLNLGLPTRYFKESYTVTAFSNTSVVGYSGAETGTLSFCRADASYVVNITPPSLSANVALTLPSASGTLARVEDLGWNSLYGAQIRPTSTNTQYTPSVDLTKVNEVMVALLYSGVTQYRQTMIFTGGMLRANVIFPDFYWAGVRLYFSLTTSSGKLVVGQAGASGSLNWSSCTVGIFYR